MKNIFAPAPKKEAMQPANIVPQQAVVMKQWTLEDLYNELGSLKWLGEDRVWDKAVETVRSRIIEMVKENRKAGV